MSTLKRVKLRHKDFQAFGENGLHHGQGPPSLSSELSLINLISIVVVVIEKAVHLVCFVAELQLRLFTQLPMIHIHITR